MQISSQVVGDGNYMTKQLKITVGLDLPVTLKVIFRSSGRIHTSFEIFDQNEDSMGCREFQNCKGLNKALVDDLNVLLEEFGIQIETDAFASISQEAYRICASRYGSGIADGDAVVFVC